MVEEENKFQKKRIIEEEPQIYPHLTKRVLNIDDFINSQQTKNQIGKFGIYLSNITKKSIYKKLLQNQKSKDYEPLTNYNSQELKEIRNKCLKKLVESNPSYFPNELGLEEYKKPINSKEEKFNKLLKHLEEQVKKERSYNNIDSRKNSSINYIASRKESYLENKRKRTTESALEDIDNNKKDKNKIKKVEKEEKEEQNVDEEDNGENGEASYYEENEEYAHPDDDDSQNYNYSYGEGNDED